MVGPVRWSVCPLFSNQRKKRFRKSYAVINVTGQHRNFYFQCTAADIHECTYVQTTSLQNKLSCAVEAVVSIESRSNFLGCSQTAAGAKQMYHVTVHVMQDLCMATILSNTSCLVCMSLNYNGV